MGAAEVACRAARVERRDTMILNCMMDVGVVCWVLCVSQVVV